MKLEDYINEKLNLATYLKLKLLKAKLDNVARIPKKWLLSLNYLKFRRDLLVNPTVYVVTERYKYKYPWIPGPLRQFTQWSKLQRIFYDADLVDVVLCPHSITASNALAWVESAVNMYYSTRLTVAHHAAVGDINALEEVTSVYGRWYKVWMSKWFTMADGEYPRAEACRFAYLAGDITREEYISIFPCAVKEDEASSYYADLDEVVSNGVYRFRTTITMCSRQVRIRYLDLFGTQFEEPLRPPTI